MTWDGWFSLGLTVAVLLMLVTTKIGPHIAMMAALTLLSVTGILSAPEALSGFSNPGLITVAAMFVIAAGIHNSGGIELLVNLILRRPKSERNALFRIFFPVAALSAFLNNTPVVATMIPALSTWAKRIDISPSKLMIPLSYSAILGGTVTLIGTSTNLVVNGQYQALTGDKGFGLFAITPLGLIVALSGAIFIIALFPLLLPKTTDHKVFGNLREFTLEVMVKEGSPLEGKTITAAGLRNLKRIFLVEIERNGRTLSAVSSTEVLQGQDRLVFAGDTEAISDLLKINGIIAPTEQRYPLETDKAERRLVEAVVSPHCSAIGSAIRDAKFRNRYGASVLAVARNGERVKGNLGSIKLLAGDTLLLEARPAFVTRQKYNKDFLLVNELDYEKPRHERACIAWLIMAVVVGGAGTEMLSMLNASLLGAGLMILTGCVTVNQAERSLDLRVIITIAASFALGKALQQTGVAQFIAHHIVELSGGHALLLLILTYISVSVLTEMITNNAAALLMLPVVLTITEQAGLSAQPFVFAIMIGASASFATPLGYQTNLMVYGPGNYKFNDFIKAGLPMNIFIGIVTLTAITLLYPLR